MKPEFQAILFFVSGEDIQTIVPIGDGNINDTFMVTLRSGERRILQRLNPSVFAHPEKVMHNMRRVLAHFFHEMQRARVSTQIKQFTLPILYPGKHGDWYTAQDGSAWRLMSMISNSISIKRVSRPDEAKQLGRALGIFHRLLSSFDAAALEETLPGFHDTQKYLHNYDRIIAGKNHPSTHGVDFCASFIRHRRDMADICANLKNTLTTGVIHGDPKVDNFLFGPDGKEVISMIDLDTIGYGPLLLDIGDALRSCCNTTGEDTGNPQQITFDPSIFQAWLTGYLSQAGSLLADDDRNHIVDFTLLITFELGLRFYSDYLDGNTYFKVHFPDQNIQRALVQFHLAESLEKQRDRLQGIVRKSSGIKQEIQ